MYHILFTPWYDKDDLRSHNSFDSSVIKREKAGHIANAIFVPLNSSTSSKHMFMAVSDFGAWKKKLFEPDTFGSIIPTPGKGGGGVWGFDLISTLRFVGRG